MHSAIHILFEIVIMFLKMLKCFRVGCKAVVRFKYQGGFCTLNKPKYKPNVPGIETKHKKFKSMFSDQTNINECIESYHWW